MSAAPLIVTLKLDERSSAFFEGERRRHFPPEQNLIPAHVTLFHHLPGGREAEIVTDLAALAEQQATFPVEVAGLRFMSRGVAYRLEAPAFHALRERLSARWADDLTAQDRQRIVPHVTVQNKVEPSVARALHERLSAGFAPFEARAEGLLLWRYLGGPWAPRGSFGFGARPVNSP